MYNHPAMWIVITQVLLLLVAPVAVAADGGWREIGVRTGIQAEPKREYFHLHEVFGVYGLPWEWRTASGWGLATRVNTSVGALYGGNEAGFIGSLGPGLVFDNSGKGPALESGASLNLLNRRQFGRQDFGSILLWGAYMGLSYRFASGLKVGYRIQHLSNTY